MLRKKFREEKKRTEKIEQAKSETNNFALPLAKSHEMDRVILNIFRILLNIAIGSCTITAV